LPRDPQVRKTVATVTDVGRPGRTTRPQPHRGSSRLRWAIAVAMAIVAVCTSTVIGSSRPAAADGVATAKAQAAALYARLQSIGQEISALGQQYDLELTRRQQLANQIRYEHQLVANDKVAVVSDRGSLQHAAVNAYVSSGSVAATNPLFAANANEVGAASVYNQIAEGSLAGSIASLTNAQQVLANEQHRLRADELEREAAAALVNQELHSDVKLQGEISSALAAANAAVRTQLALQQQEAQNAPSTGLYDLPDQNFPAPPPNSQANVAVDAALSYLGVPYCWGGASRACVDCSGLTMLAWGAAGASLPHYSGAQMADSTPVPVPSSDPLEYLEPGDLLFYGPGGSVHVAMYIGDGKIIEAPYTGAVVWITAAFFGYDFAGAGRP
jgi:cell wall-associated NlpC family hydrolase